jgi:hypothetical protein
MSEVIQRVTNLTGKEVWIIDDSLPVDQVDFDRDDLIQGMRPIDRGTLRALMDKQWTEVPVAELCSELLSTAQNVTGFIQPTSAVEYLAGGALIPDAVIFDLKYRTVRDDQVRESLRSLLTSSISVVQVYTNDSLETAKQELGALLLEFPTRLIEPKSKSDTNGEALAEAIRRQVDKSLSSKLARELRRLTLRAVELVLVKIDGLPDSTLLTLLGGESAMEETDLVELLSVKVTEALYNAPELLSAINEYVADKDVPAERQAAMVANIAELVVANARESIRSSGGLLKLSENWERAQPAQAVNAADDAPSMEVIRDFFQFRAYSIPPLSDVTVLTGDIVLVTGKEGVDDVNATLPDLYVIITPLCDLAHFWKKTKGVLTLARMAPIDARGSEHIWRYSKKTFGTVAKNFPGSITAQNPMVLPSVRLADSRAADYALFAREMFVEHVPIADDANADTSLTYNNLNGRLVRQCRVSQPFLSGILDEIRNVLFRSGIPDFPDQEKARMAQLFKDLNK